MATIKVLGKKEIAQVTDMKKVIACVEDVYCQKAKGETVVWPTTFYEFNPGHADMDIKSGYLENLIGTADEAALREYRVNLRHL